MVRGRAGVQGLTAALKLIAYIALSVQLVARKAEGEKKLRLVIVTSALFLSACGAREENETNFPEGFPELGSFDVVVEQSKEGFRVSRLCGKEGSCERPEQYPCKLVKRGNEQMLAKVTRAMSQPAQFTHKYIARFTGWERNYRDRCELELSGLEAVRRHGLIDLKR